MSDQDVLAAFKLIGDVIESLDDKERARVLRAMYIAGVDLKNVDVELDLIGLMEALFKHMEHEQRVRVMNWANAWVRDHGPRIAVGPPRRPIFPPPRSTYTRRARHCRLCQSTDHDARRCPKANERQWPQNIEVE